MKNYFAGDKKANEVYSKSLKKMINNRILSDCQESKAYSTIQKKYKIGSQSKVKTRTTDIIVKQSESQDRSILSKRYSKFTKLSALNGTRSQSSKFTLDPQIMQSYEKLKQKHEQSKQILATNYYKNNFLKNVKFKQLCVNFNKVTNNIQIDDSNNDNSDNDNSNKNLFEKKIDQIMRIVAEEHSQDKPKRYSKHFRVISEPYQYKQIFEKTKPEKIEIKKYSNFLDDKIQGNLQRTDRLNFSNQRSKFKLSSSMKRNKVTNQNRNNVEARRIKTEMKNYQNQRLRIIGDEREVGQRIWQKAFSSHQIDNPIRQRIYLPNSELEQQNQVAKNLYEKVSLPKQIINIKKITKHTRKGNSFANKMFRID